MANYKSAITFGLVHIPVSLNPVITNNDTSFNMLHKKCEQRIKYQKYCPHCKKEVKQNEIIKGYEYMDKEFITLSDEEMKKLKSNNDKIIEIISFVNLKEIDPIYFEKSYYLMADIKNKAYSLFKEALKKENKVALAKTVLGNKFYYCLVRFGHNTLIMNTLYFNEEIKEIETRMTEEFTKKEMDLAVKLINEMTDSFKPDEYLDEYQNNIKKAIETKVQGKQIKPAKTKRPQSVNDLMAALQKSIKQRKTA